MNHLAFGMRTIFFRSVVLSMMICLLFVTTSNSHISICITLNCGSVNVCTFMDGCIFASTMFSFLASIYVACASIDYYSTTSFSSDFSMNTRSTNVVLSHVCKVAHHHFLLRHKNSTINVPFWFI
jgi:hypothetical protein